MKCYSQTVTCIDRIAIEVVGFNQLVTVALNGAINPPIADLPTDIFDVKFQSGWYTITMQIRLPNGILTPVTVVFGGGNDLRVTVADPFFGDLCGLCGNANGNPMDDFQILQDDGSQLPTTSVSQFGVSWANYDLSMDEGCEVTVVNTDECLGDKKRRAEIFCSAMSSQAEAIGCADFISPLEFINTCVFDYCAADGTAGACASYMQYFGRCAELGFTGAVLPAVCCEYKIITSYHTQYFIFSSKYPIYPFNF